MFEMFETYGKQITAFLSEARTLLLELKTENAALKAEIVLLREQTTRIEGAHLLLMEWLAEIDDSEAQELADVATLAAEEATAAAETAEAAAIVSEEAATVAVEEVTPETEEEAVQETIPPATPETPSTEGEHLPETPVPEETPAEPETIPTEKKNKRHWI